MLDPSDVTMEVTLWEQKGSWQNTLKKWIIENQTFHAQSEDRLDRLEEKPTYSSSLDEDSLNTVYRSRNHC